MNTVKSMKPLKVMWLLGLGLLVSSMSLAQNAVKTWTISGGYTIQNNWTAGLSYEFSGNGYNRWGVQAETLLLKNADSASRMLQPVYAGGLFFKRQFFSTKNFSANYFIGGMAGTDKSRFIYYPFLGFEQVFYPDQTLQVFIAQRGAYIFKIGKNWQPSIHAGIKISY